MMGRSPSDASNHHGLPTPRSTLRAGYLDVLVWCKACHRQAPADLPLPMRQPTHRLGGDVALWRQTGVEPRRHGGLNRRTSVPGKRTYRQSSPADSC